MKRNIIRLFFIIIITIPFLVSCSSQTNGNDTLLSGNDAAAVTISDAKNGETTSDTLSSGNGGSNPFYLLKQAFSKTKNQLLIIFEILLAVLLILSTLLFWTEHIAQPKVYKRYTTSLLWTFVKCIQDPGEMAPPKPVTWFGRVIANVIGLVGVALFALPAGIISSGFIGAMDDEKQAVLIQKNISELHYAFERKKDRLTGYQITPAYVSVTEIQARLGLKEDDILDAVSHDDHYRLINLCSTQTAEEHPQDKLAVEHYTLNTVYGQCIDRGSKVTIFSPSNIADPIMGWWSYYLAKIGGFNYVSRELGQSRPYKSFYTYKPEENIFGNEKFMEDMNRLVSADDYWVVTCMPASGSQEPSYPTQIHFAYGSKKGDTTYSDPNILLHDTVLFESFYRGVSNVMLDGYKLKTDKQLYHDNSNPAIFARHLNHHPNAITIRIAWSITCWDMRAIKIAQEMAKLINTKILGLEDNPDVPEMTLKGIGYEGYTD